MTISWEPMNSDDYLRDECEEDAVEHKLVYCPFCGGEGTMEWFEGHDHGPSPFGETE